MEVLLNSVIVMSGMGTWNLLSTSWGLRKDKQLFADENADFGNNVTFPTR